MSSFRDLDVWQLGMDLVVEVYKLCKILPPEERFALTDQLRRAVISVPSNVAEGFSKNSPKEFRHFLQIASGSRAEVQTQLLIAERVGLLTREQTKPALLLTERLGKALHALAEYQHNQISPNVQTVTPKAPRGFRYECSHHSPRTAGPTVAR